MISVAIGEEIFARPESNAANASAALPSSVRFCCALLASIAIRSLTFARSCTRSRLSEGCAAVSYAKLSIEVCKSFSRERGGRTPLSSHGRSIAWRRRRVAPAPRSPHANERLCERKQRGRRCSADSEIALAIYQRLIVRHAVEVRTIGAPNRARKPSTVHAQESCS